MVDISKKICLWEFWHLLKTIIRVSDAFDVKKKKNILLIFLERLSDPGLIWPSFHVIQIHKGSEEGTSENLI